MKANEANIIALERIAEAARCESTVIDLANLGLTAIPEEIGRLRALEHLNASGNQISVLPLTIGRLSRLKEIVLDKNPIEELPTTLERLTRLKLLSIQQAKLKRIPECLRYLKRLEILLLSANQLEVIPKWINSLKDIQQIDLRNNRIASLPHEFYELEKLVHLDLGANELLELDPAFQKLCSLETLDLSGNQLEVLPAEMLQIKSLQSVNLANNKISKLPAYWQRLSKLRMLDITGNDMDALPDGLLTLAEIGILKELYLHQNPKLDLPPEIIGNASYHVRAEGKSAASPIDILRYVFEKEAAKAGGRTRRLDEAKVIIVGEGSVGKTTLLRRLRGLPGDSPGKTEGIDIFPDTFTHEDGRQIKVNFWDFGGQEIMHATHQFFLTQRTVYLLVINSRSEPETSRMSYWLRMVRSFAGSKTPVIVVLNKADQHTLEVDKKSYSKKFPNIREYVRTCADEARVSGIDELWNVIRREVCNLEHIGQEFPASWLDIKSQVEHLRDTRNYIAWSEYAKLCEDYGIVESDAQRRLVDFLHALGTMLNFRNHDERLQDTNVLNPIWVTQGVYRILNTPLHRQGHILLSDLPAILSGREYADKTSRDFIITIMERFELCFRVNEGGADAEYIVPDLLSPEEPESLRWNPVSPLRFQYHFDVLPQAIIVRFVVRRGNQPGQIFWRNGIYFTLDRCPCLVRADLESSKIFIEVDGPRERRKRALGQIRDELEYIQNSLADLEISSRIPHPEQPDITISYEHLLRMEQSGEASHFPEGAMSKVDVKRLLDNVVQRERKILDLERELASARHAIEQERLVREELEKNLARQLGADEEERLKNNKRAVEKRLLCVLFLDVKGFSSLNEEEQRNARELIRDRSAELMIRYNIKYSNTWGDALVLCHEDVNIVSEFATRLLRYLHADDLEGRFGLSYGNVDLSYNQARKALDIDGAIVNQAARLEPMAKPGEILATPEVQIHLDSKHFHTKPVKRSITKPFAHYQAGDELDCLVILKKAKGQS